MFPGGYMKTKNIKIRKFRRIEGFLFRIIISCIIFILLFISKHFTVDVFHYNTDKVVVQLQDNTVIESLETKIKNWFQ